MSGCGSMDRAAKTDSRDPIQRVRAEHVARVTTIAPFPRGLAMVDGELYVLCRGRVRGAGGVTAAIEDQAGTLYRVDPDITEPIDNEYIDETVRTNGDVLARPTQPPFFLWDRTSAPPESDRWTDRPYCTLRYHEPTKSFYICAFSGIDKPRKTGQVSFSKNLTDGLLRYDLRTNRWHEIERHRIDAGGNYPHHDITVNDPPHGWLNGPDNCLTVGNQLYAVAKDNNLLVRYDLSELTENPHAPPPPSERVLGAEVDLAGIGTTEVYGHSALAYRDGWLYVGTRTSSVIFRIRLDADALPVQPVRGELLAQFKPYDPRTLTSADITDMDFDAEGRLYVISAKPSRVYRFTPDSHRVYDGIHGEPWADLAALTDNPKMKSENILVHDGHVYVTSGDGYGYQHGADGTVYRVTIPQ